MFAGLKHLRELTQTKAMKEAGAYFLDSKYPTRRRIAEDKDPDSDDFLNTLMEHMASVIWHPAGSCKMGAIGDNSAVVDPQLRLVIIIRTHAEQYIVFA